MDVIERLLINEDLRVAGYLTEDERLSYEELAIRWTAYVDELIARNTTQNEHYYRTECCICFDSTDRKWKASECSHPYEICETCWVNIIFTTFNNNSIIVHCPICRGRVETLECVD